MTDSLLRLNPIKSTTVLIGLGSQWNKDDVTNSTARERLEEVLVLELLKDGGRNYSTHSIRSLYKHVMDAITNIKKDKIPLKLLPVLEENKSSQEHDEFTVEGEREVQSKVSQGNPTVSDRQPKQEEKQIRSVSKSKSSKSRRASIDAGQNPGVTYRERLGGYLHPRDMRKLVTPFSPSNEPELIVRRHAMLFNVDPLRCIILRDRLLVLVPDGADSVLVDLERRVRGANMELELSFFTNNNDPATSSQDNPGQQQQATSLNEPPKQSNKSVWTRLSHAMSLNLSKSSQSSDNSNQNYRQEDNPVDVGESNHSGTNQSKNLQTSLAPQPVEVKREETETANQESELAGAALDQTSMEWADMSNQAWIELPFELQCTDAVLQTVISMLSEETNELHDKTQQYISEIIYGKRGKIYTSEDPSTLIRVVKDAVSEMTSRVKGLVQSLNTILDDYEDMALMNLSRLITNPERFIQPVPIEVLEEESDEPELILESYLQQSLSLTNKLNLIQGQIDTTAELVHQKLDSNRNKILLANTIITTVILCATFATLVAGIFGMNLNNGMEDSETAFNLVVGWIVACGFVLFIVIMFIMYRTGAIPSWTGI